MVILGIDPGVAIVGYGVVECVGGNFRCLEYGCITTPAHTLLEDRLSEIYEGMQELISRHRPDCMSVEELFFNNNQKTAVDVAQARGVILLAANQARLPIYEYTPLQVKSAVVGYGRAEKQQVMYMVRQYLHMKETPKPDDAADAIAIAICHGSTAMHKY
ncbi:MAG: crossover junction endodeoxyribonuclease RuvC [Ruminococcaceae bacterium]|nr:crossover junction endodeoxyribonuclease RuvC [Oscillospiraceae bacterium]